MQHFWKSWMWPLDPFTRLVGGIVTNQLQGVEVVCRPEEFSVFPAPSGQTCAQWAGEYAELVGGYLDNPESTGDCNFCQYRYGQAFFPPLEIDFANRWRDFGIMVSFRLVPIS
jgi:ATP-binding cassette subfamily G (WHITE) protein 2 (SNQ2)